HRPHGMDHPPCRKAPAGGRHGPSGGEPLREALGPDLLARLEDVRSALAVDRSIDPSPSHERGIGRVDDGGHLLRGDVSLHQFDPHPAALLLSIRSLDLGKGFLTLAPLRTIAPIMLAPARFEAPLLASL